MAAVGLVPQFSRIMVLISFGTMLIIKASPPAGFLLHLQCRIKRQISNFCWMAHAEAGSFYGRSSYSMPVQTQATREPFTRGSGTCRHSNPASADRYIFTTAFLPQLDAQVPREVAGVLHIRLTRIIFSILPDSVPSFVRQPCRIE